jgi:lactam utilization protein B
VRKEKAAERLAEARRRVPQMLAEEQALRDSLDDLSKRSRAMLRHVELDRAIAANIERSKALQNALTEALEELTKALGSIVAARIAAPRSKPSDALFDAAAAHLQRLETIYAETQSMSEEIGQMLVDRADLGVVSIDREHLAAGLESMATNLEIIGTDVARKRAYYDSLCEGREER